MAEAVSRVDAIKPSRLRDGHRGWVRISHWIVVLAFTTLAVTGILILMVHPRLYWGEAGNDLMPALIELPISHGAPLRVRVETQLGYKSMKFLRRIVVTEEFEDHGLRGNIQTGWSWYAGI